MNYKPKNQFQHQFIIHTSLARMWS